MGAPETKGERSEGASQSTTKSLLVLARSDHAEAMRVAAGMTIFGHAVRLVFMTRPIGEEDLQGAHAELLELSGITPETTVREMAGTLDWLSPRDLAEAISVCDMVVTV